MVDCNGRSGLSLLIESALIEQNVDEYASIFFTFSQIKQFATQKQFRKFNRQYLKNQQTVLSSPDSPCQTVLKFPEIHARQFWIFSAFYSPLFRSWQSVRYIKWEKALCKMRKSEKTTFQWLKVSKLLTTLPRHRADIRTCLRFLFRAPEVPVLRVRKSHFYCFSSLQKSHFRCPKQKSETCSEIPSVTWLRGKKFAHFRLLESGFLAFSHFI